MQQQRGRDRFEAPNARRRQREYSVGARIFMASWWVLFLLPWLLVSWGPAYVIAGYVLVIVLIGFVYRLAFGRSQPPGASEEGYRAEGRQREESPASPPPTQWDDEQLQVRYPEQGGEG